MKYYGKAEEAARRLLLAFETGNLPQALAQVFLRRKDDVPCRQWSWNNQIMTALMGYHDARGFQQWQEVGRKVKKGEKAFAILAPLDDDEEGSGQRNGRGDRRAERLRVQGHPGFRLRADRRRTLNDRGRGSRELDCVPSPFGSRAIVGIARHGLRGQTVQTARSLCPEAALLPLAWRTLRRGRMNSFTRQTTETGRSKSAGSIGAPKWLPSWAAPSCWNVWDSARKATGAAVGSTFASTPKGRKKTC